jgi:hypothetical protein
MPQPYRGDGSVYFAFSVESEPHPLGAHVAKIAAMWTFSEDVWGYMLAVMLSFEAGAGVAMYHALTGTGAQRSLLNEIADQYLDSALRVEFGALMKTNKARASERNAVVHGLWFGAQNDDSTLILVPRNALSTLLAKGLQRRARAHIRGEPLIEPPPTDFSGWRTYRRSDFMAIEKRIHAFVLDQDALLAKIVERQSLPKGA